MSRQDRNFGIEAPKVTAMPEPITLNIVMQPQTDLPITYCNQVYVFRTPSEWALNFCLISPPFVPLARTNTLEVPIVARMMMPATLGQGLLMALAGQYTEEELAPIIAAIQEQAKDRAKSAKPSLKSEEAPKDTTNATSR